MQVKFKKQTKDECRHKWIIWCRVKIGERAFVLKIWIYGAALKKN